MTVVGEKLARGIGEITFVPLATGWPGDAPAVENCTLGGPGPGLGVPPRLELAPALLGLGGNGLVAVGVVGDCDEDGFAGGE